MVLIANFLNWSRFWGGDLRGDMKKMQTLGCGVVLHHLLMVLALVFVSEEEELERRAKRAMEKNAIWM